MNTSEILNKAADLIEERGWSQLQGWTTDGGTGLCLEGGIQAAAGIAWSFELPACPAYEAVMEYVGPEVTRLTGAGATEETHRLYKFNDVEGRTANEVIEVLRATALIESVREGAPLSVLEPAPAHVSA